MAKLNNLNKVCWLLCLTLTFFLIHCGLGDIAEAGRKKKKKKKPLVSYITPLKRSFVLKEGRYNNFTCMVVNKRGDVYAAGVSGNNSVIFKLDSKLKKIKEMVKFGSARDEDPITDMAIDSRGNIFVVGYTGNPNDFPVTKGAYRNPMYRNRGAVSSQGFVTKFSPDLKLLSSTCIGGDNSDRFYAVAIDRHDNVYAAGHTQGAGPSNYHKSPRAYIPPAGAYDRDPTPNHQSKGLVVKLSNDLSTLKAATLLGGKRKRYESDDEIYDLAVDRDGNVWVTGQTNSYDFPVTTGCVGSSYSGKGDVFVSKFDPDLSQLLASTYLGGMNQEMATAMVVDKRGNVFVGGWTESPDLPMVPGCFDTKYSHEEEDAFIVKLSGDLKKLKAATYLGGDYDASGYGDDLLSAMALSDNGKILCVTGRSESENFPVTPKCYKKYTNDSNPSRFGVRQRNNRKPRENGSDDPDFGDGFITLLDADLKKCRYSTFMGGDHLEYVDDILFDGNDLLVAGVTYSWDFPRITTKDKRNGAVGFAIRFNWKKSR